MSWNAANGCWVDELLPSVIENGVGTFLLATDDRPSVRSTWTELIAPIPEQKTNRA